MTSLYEEKAEKIASAQLTVANEELQALAEFEITSTADNEFAAEMVQSVIARYKFIETERKKITDPLNAALKATNALFAGPKEALEKIEAALKLKIARFIEGQQQANVAALEAAQNASTPEEATEALAEIQNVEKPKSVSIRYRWVAEVIDESKVPQMFRTVDRKLIQKFASNWSHATPPEFDGIRFTREPIVSSRSK